MSVKAIFSLNGTHFSVNLSFRLVRTSFLLTGNSIFTFHMFFLLMENITEIWGKSDFKEDHIPASGHQFFFDLFRYFSKWKLCFRIVEAYFSISSTRRMQTNFLPTDIVFFWSDLFCCYILLLWLRLIEAICRRKGDVLTNITDFLSDGTYFFPFSQTTVNCSFWKQFIFQLAHIFHPILHSG